MFRTKSNTTPFPSNHSSMHRLSDLLNALETEEGGEVKKQSFTRAVPPCPNSPTRLSPAPHSPTRLPSTPMQIKDDGNVGAQKGSLSDLLKRNE